MVTVLVAMVMEVVEEMVRGKMVVVVMVRVGGGMVGEVAKVPVYLVVSKEEENKEDCSVAILGYVEDNLVEVILEAMMEVVTEEVI